MLKTEEIVLRMLRSEADLQQALKCPVSAADRTLYAAARPGYAKALIAHGLPCIFAEQRQETAEHSEVVEQLQGAGHTDILEQAENAAEQIYGVDMVVLEADGWDWQHDQEFLLRIWQRHYHFPWTIAETERLLIRESVPEDFAQINVFYEEEKENPDVKPFPVEAEEAFVSYIRCRYPVFGYGLWTVTEKESGAVIGRVGFEELPAQAVQASFPQAEKTEVLPELCCLTGKKFRRKGYAKEAARAALSYAETELGFSRVFYRTSRENAGSNALAQILGFISLNRYSLTKSQYNSIYNVYLFRFRDGN